MQKENLTADCGSERNEAGEEQQEGRLNGKAIVVSYTVIQTGLRSARTCDYVHG
jgi:hypothetical protein